MSDVDACLASVGPLPNCAEDVPTSTADDDGSHALGQSNGSLDDGNGKSIVQPAKVKTTIEGGEAKDESAVDLNVTRADDHEISKGKRKCVQFTTTLHGDPDDMTLRKFIEGDEILDKKNPFKDDDDQSFFAPRDRMQDSTYFSNAPDVGNDEDVDDSNDDVDNDSEFITKEEILRQSKYVKTYIKNPDKRLNYDKSVIQKLNAIKAQGRDVRDVVVIECTSPPPSVRPPIPAPRAIYQQSDRNNNNRRQRTPQPGHTGNPKPKPRARRDYAEVKVRTGSAEAEESLYDSNEVVLNALKFDSRFRQVEFGSQDDIDTIAEKTEDAEGTVAASDDHTIPQTPLSTPTSTPSRKGQPEAKKSSFADDVKKSFSNTVKSADFMKYLQSKGLSLVPARQPKSIDGSKRPADKGRLSSVSSDPATSPRPPTKLSVLSKFLQNSLFTPKTPNDPAYSALFPRSSTPVHYGTQTHSRAQHLVRNGLTGGSYGNGSLVKRSVSVDVKPKVSFKQFDQVDAGSIRRPVSVNDFDRPKLRTGFANQSMSRIESARRPVKNAGVQVNLANGTSSGTTVSAPGGRTVAVPLRPGSWQPVTTTFGEGGVVNLPYSVNHRSNARFHGGASSLQTVVPLYAEPLRETAMIPTVTTAGNQSTAGSGYHIYEQTPDNLRREMMYGKIGHLGNGQLNNGWHPQDRRSYSSMQEGGGAMLGNGTYGRLRPLYVSSPLSTQSTPIRRASDNLDREQILHRIYDFCRRSIRNSSKSSVHSNQTEPLYQATPSVRMVGSGSFPIERPRVQRVQSLSNPRTATGTNYMRVVGPMRANHPSHTGGSLQGTLPSAARRNQHDRNIENIYAFVNKKMNQINVTNGDTASGTAGAVDGSTRSLHTAPSTLRRVTFSRMSGPEDSSHGFEEADYVNIRGAPDGIQYRTTQC
uniref:Uncharacterized protein n=1 Tax=Anopheles atroparvus TaxID=41427 RepID=A0A182JHV8_ANOAO